jgi:hypothetical protein
LKKIKGRKSAIWAKKEPSIKTRSKIFSLLPLPFPLTLPSSLSTLNNGNK